ncbi:MAG: anhydro-N-acetylmuramic acid kinase [Candidatus Binatus sp.]|uniref:anhydro-N-acetylmuramic acid kinase n=1 Tax=Candidatus Binatus sp. TaxID=2811406 RepID=UPI002728194C|nr:anhydro-N-acetylmuramic acid kinase [Candidatus Binatus sp.]MDO8432671.1 anhydro-N-acetylmuramic acid kinase [Candidatus Binatus sp.]
MSAVRISLEGGKLLAIGLMSGTSHDGVSAAMVEIDEGARPPAKVVAFQTFPYSSRMRGELLEASAGTGVGSAAISTLNVALGRTLGAAAIAIAKEAGVEMSEVAFIGSHGHTFFHRPPRSARRGQPASTLQLGESSEIAAITGVPVVADFRPMDIALGGEGAPLAPLAHQWMFADRKLGRIVQNIGGIGNATYIPPGARLGNPDLIAFDTGPGMGMLDALTSRISAGRMRMDRDGRIAARGHVNDHLLAELMRNPYFKRRPPKSTGREEFGPPLLDQIVIKARRRQIVDFDLVATITALTARSIGDAARDFILPRGRLDQLIATGGGARNPTLMRMLAAELPEVEVLTADKVGVDGDSLEAVAFAILGYQMLRGRQGNLPTVTGARAPAILGKLTLPPTPISES